VSSASTSQRRRTWWARGNAAALAGYGVVLASVRVLCEFRSFTQRQESLGVATIGDPYGCTERRWSRLPRSRATLLAFQNMNMHSPSQHPAISFRKLSSCFPDDAKCLANLIRVCSERSVVTDGSGFESLCSLHRSLNGGALETNTNAGWRAASGNSNSRRMPQSRRNCALNSNS